MKFVRSRVAAVTAGAGLLVAMGGVGGAVASNLVGSHQIRNNSIRSIDVHNGTLGLKDMNGYTVKHILDNGRRGPRGPEGPAGAPGTPGTQLDYVESSVLTVSAGGWAGWSCPDGEVAVGGGAKGVAASRVIPVQGPVAYPHYTYKDGESGVAVQFSAAGDATVYVVCATLPAK
jgi:hypothetical protein